MEFLTAALVLLAQEKRNGDLRPEDLRLIVERDLFTPYKPEKPKREEKKREEKKEESKAGPTPPVVTGFLQYPEGFCVLVTDKSKGASVQYKVGDRLGGGTITAIDNTRAVIELVGGVKELRLGDGVTDGPVRAPTIVEVVGQLQGAAKVEQQDVKQRMRDRMRKRLQDEPEGDEETPRKKKRGEGR